MWLRRLTPLISNACCFFASESKRQKSNQVTNNEPSNQNGDYGRRKPQIRKGDLYMFTALWMQESPWAMKSTEELNVVGAVFVLPNDRVLSADCTRQHPDLSVNYNKQNSDDKMPAVHGAIRPLIKYPNRVKGCQVYLSRKPCAHCVKMLVQAGVSKVFYLPLKPEKPNENKSVDALFQVSEVSREFYVPNITQDQIKELKKQNQQKRHPYGTKEETSSAKFQEDQKWDEDWINDIKEELDWQEFQGKIREQVRQDMNKAFAWFCQATFAVGKTKEMAWEEIGEKWGKYDPKEVTHLSRLAQMLSNRTDDPNRGVGCVIAIGEEIVSIGWNGFPSKALYGNHPRGSDKDETSQKKYPHVIHAEQNALLSRNERNLKNSVAYVNKIPCNECLPMLYELGVKKVALPYFDESPKKVKESETYFYDVLESNKFQVLRAPKKEI